MPNIFLPYNNLFRIHIKVFILFKIKNRLCLKFLDLGYCKYFENFDKFKCVYFKTVLTEHVQCRFLFKTIRTVLTERLFESIDFALRSLI